MSASELALAEPGPRLAWYARNGPVSRQELNA